MSIDDFFTAHGWRPPRWRKCLLTRGPNFISIHRTTFPVTRRQKNDWMKPWANTREELSKYGCESAGADGFMLRDPSNRLFVKDEMAKLLGKCALFQLRNSLRKLGGAMHTHLPDECGEYSKIGVSLNSFFGLCVSFHSQRLWKILKPEDRSRPISGKLPFLR